MGGTAGGVLGCRARVHRRGLRMSSIETVNAKYVFLDVVGYSKGRTIEAQSHIIHALNRVIVDAVAASGVPKDQVLLLPTGDGVGIVLVDVMRPYDVDVGIALDLLARIAALNAEQTDRQRRPTRCRRSWPAGERCGRPPRCARAPRW